MWVAGMWVVGMWVAGMWVAGMWVAGMLLCPEHLLGPSLLLLVDVLAVTKYKKKWVHHGCLSRGNVLEVR
jgi:hypothetical protein